MPTFQPADYKSDLKPVWCAGCGDFGALASLHRAMAKLQLEPWNTVVLSGIGCSSRLPGYVSTFGFNGVHGRALTLATGVKVARPELNVIAVGGDGDGIAIGGNHFLHAARRNLDIAYFLMDNEIYGLTKGQAAPTTPTGDKTKSTYWGNPEPSVDPCELAISFGATWVGRGFSGDPKTLTELMTRGDAAPRLRLPERHVPVRDLARRRPVQDPQGEAGFLPPDHDRADRAAALRYTRETDILTTGVLYEVRQPSLRRADRRGAGQGAEGRPRDEHRRHPARLRPRVLVSGTRPGRARRKMKSATESEVEGRLAALEQRLEEFSLDLRRLEKRVESSRPRPPS